MHSRRSASSAGYFHHPRRSGPTATPLPTKTFVRKGAPDVPRSPPPCEATPPRCLRWCTVRCTARSDCTRAKRPHAPVRPPVVSKRIPDNGSLPAGCPLRTRCAQGEGPVGNGGNAYLSRSVSMSVGLETYSTRSPVAVCTSKQPHSRAPALSRRTGVQNAQPACVETTDARAWLLRESRQRRGRRQREELGKVSPGVGNGYRRSKSTRSVWPQPHAASDESPAD